MKKITKKANKRKIVNKRFQRKQINKNKHKVSGNKDIPKAQLSQDDISRRNEMLKVMLSKQQPTIPTQDPNMLAANRRFDQMDEKFKKQIDTLQSAINIKDRELENVRKDRVHQEHVFDLKQQKEAKEAEIDKNKQMIKDNVRYQDVEDKKKEIDKLDAELKAVQAIIDSDAFKKPKEAYVKAAMELEKKNQELKDKRAIQELMDENARQEGILLAQQQLNKDRHTVPRPRYDERYIKYEDEQRTKPVTHPMRPDEYGKLPMYDNRGKRVYDAEWDESTKHYKTGTGKMVHVYEYENNNITDYAYTMLQLQEQQKQNLDIKRKQELAEYERSQYLKLEDDMNKQRIDNDITRLQTEALDEQNRQLAGKENQDRIVLENAQNAREKAVLDTELQNKQELNTALVQNIEARKRKQYMDEMNRVMDTETYKQQRDEIAKTKQETNNLIEMQQALDHQNQAKQHVIQQMDIQALQRLYMSKGGNVSPEDVVNFANQVVSSGHDLMKNKPTLDAWYKYKVGYSNLDHNGQYYFSKALEDLNLNSQGIKLDSASEKDYNTALELIDRIKGYQSFHPQDASYEGFMQELNG